MGHPTSCIALHKRISGLTAVELPVVLGTIAVALAVVTSPLNTARQSARKMVCAANQRNIHTAMMVYLQDNDDTFFPGQNGYRVFDLGLYSGRTGQLLTPWNSRAYVGLGYLDYLRGDYTVFKCPSKKWNQGWWLAARPSDEKAFDYSDYGFNGHIMWTTPTQPHQMVYSPGSGSIKLTDFSDPGATIVLHDSGETALDNNGDMLYLNPIYDLDGQVLSQHRDGEQINPDFYEGWTQESFRHADSTNVLWLDGHVSNRPKDMTGGGFTYEEYTGGLLLSGD